VLSDNWVKVNVCRLYAGTGILPLPDVTLCKAHICFRFLGLASESSNYFIGVRGTRDPSVKTIFSVSLEKVFGVAI